jgi:hypothetical protein
MVLETKSKSKNLKHEEGRTLDGNISKPLTNLTTTGIPINEESE